MLFVIFRGLGMPARLTRIREARKDYAGLSPLDEVYMRPPAETKRPCSLSVFPASQDLLASS